MSLMTVLLNAITREASIAFTGCEKHHSTAVISRKTTKSVTLIYYLNTALIPVLAPFVVGGNTDIFSAGWYYSVGTIITISVMYSSLLVFTELVTSVDTFKGMITR
jgi:hypothetical protein